MSSLEDRLGKTEEELNTKSLEIFNSFSGWRMDAGVFVLTATINALIGSIYMKDETGKKVAKCLLEGVINTLKETHKCLTEEIDKGTLDERL